MTKEQQQYALPPGRHLDREELKRIAGQPRAWLIVGVVALLIILLLSRHALFDRSPPPPAKVPADAFRPTPEQLAQLKIQPVRYGANAELVRATGSIQADADHSTPILLPFSGQVVDVMVEPGQRVTQGQALLKVASPELVNARNMLQSAAAQQATAKEAAAVTAANLKRQKEIYQTAGGALKDYLQAQSDAVAAQSNLRTAESGLQTAKDTLGLFGSPGELPQTVNGKATTTYRAPVAGLIADRSVAPGQFISAGGSTALLTITNPAHVWLVAQLAESDANTIRLGDHVTVTTPALPGREFSAVVDNIGAALDPATHRLPVRATVANPDGALKPQMFASFVIRRPITGGAGVLVPAAAVIHEGDVSRVWVMAGDGLLHGRPVKTGETEGGLTRIVDGLKSGDRIVTSGAIFVNEAGLEQ